MTNPQHLPVLCSFWEVLPLFWRKRLREQKSTKRTPQRRPCCLLNHFYDVTSLSAPTLLLTLSIGCYRFSSLEVSFSGGTIAASWGSGSLDLGSSIPTMSWHYSSLFFLRLCCKWHDSPHRKFERIHTHTHIQRPLWTTTNKKTLMDLLNDYGKVSGYKINI